MSPLVGVVVTLEDEIDVVLVEDRHEATRAGLAGLARDEKGKSGGEASRISRMRGCWPESRRASLPALGGGGVVGGERAVQHGEAGVAGLEVVDQSVAIPVGPFRGSSKNAR